MSFSRKFVEMMDRRHGKTYDDREAIKRANAERYGYPEPIETKSSLRFAFCIDTEENTPGAGASASPAQIPEFPDMESGDSWADLVEEELSGIGENSRAELPLLTKAPLPPDAAPTRSRSRSSCVSKQRTMPGKANAESDDQLKLAKPGTTFPDFQKEETIELIRSLSFSQGKTAREIMEHFFGLGYSRYATLLDGRVDFMICLIPVLDDLGAFEHQACIVRKPVRTKSLADIRRELEAQTTDEGKLRVLKAAGFRSTKQS